MSTLFIVATPIGNLQDITQRAVETLRQVSLIAAEDTRVTRKLLSHVGSTARMLSYNENSPPGRLKQLLDHLESSDLALVTDAGTPGVSDPGPALVREAAGAGHTVTPVPGPSAITAALSVSGFDAGRFTFLGFPPRKRVERQKLFAENADLPLTVVLLEAPHRLRQTLEDLAVAIPGREILVCRELTKLHEELFRGTVESALEHFQQPRGEFVLLIAPQTQRTAYPSGEELDAAVKAALEGGLKGRAAVDRVVEETGLSRSRVYPAVLEATRQYTGS